MSASGKIRWPSTRNFLAAYEEDLMSVDNIALALVTVGTSLIDALT